MPSTVKSTKSSRFSLRSSAYLCVLCVQSAALAQRTQRYAEKYSKELQGRAQRFQLVREDGSQVQQHFAFRDAGDDGR